MPWYLHLTVYHCSFGSNELGESRAPKGLCVRSKSPSRVRDGDEGIHGRNGGEKYFLKEEALITCDFHESETLPLAYLSSCS